ncbi:MAG: hypothetical protein CMD26_00855 [Flavobacteriales bacterium]|nr:hypothetical protein [Flavobacteriales bacterium]
MKNWILPLFLAVLYSCNTESQNKFIINGKTDRIGDAILLKIDPSINQIDTTSIKNGMFKFEKKIKEEELYRVKFHDGSSFDLLANMGEKINIDFQGDGLLITGSEGSQKIVELDNMLFELIHFKDSITQELQTMSKNENYEAILTKKQNEFFEKLELHRAFLKDFIEKNKESKVTLIALFQTYNSSSPVLSIDEDLEDFEKVLDNLKVRFPESNHITLLNDQITKLKPLANGQIAPNFTLPDVNKKPLSLSSLKGKVVLIDFWASWCRPCRIANPKLVELHKKYSKNGFEILSVSLDGTQRQQDPKKEWIQAINQDNITDFKHVSELKGWNTSVRDLYNLNSIPHTILLDKEGKIVGKNIRGDNLEMKIKKLVNDEG